MQQTQGLAGFDVAIVAQRKSVNTKIFMLIAVFAVSFLLRSPTLFRSVINWDESLYFLMAEQWRAGHLPYTVLWDNKPIGIYAIFALAQAVFGDDIVSIRMAAVIAVTVTTLCVIRIASLIPRADPYMKRFCAGLAGCAFAIASISNDGLAANAELFMIAFTSLAVVCAVTPEGFAGKPALRGAATGLFLGLAFMTKYVVVFEFPAVAFALFLLRPPFRPAEAGRLLAGAVAGGLLPILLTILLYMHAGQLDLWFDASIASNFRRAATEVAPLNLALALRFLKWLPLFAAAAAVFVSAPLIGQGRKGKPIDPVVGRFHIFLMLWILGGMLGLSAAKSFYSHYFIQLLPALCVALAWVALKFTPVVALRSPARIAALTVLTLALPALSAAASVANVAQPLAVRREGHVVLFPDTSTLIAQDVRKASGAAPPSLYVFDHEPIIYALAKAPLPTRYAYPAFLTTCFLQRVAQVDAPAEVDRILAQRPQFIVRTLDSIAKLPIDPASYARLDAAVAARYDVWGRYDGAVVYRLRAADRQPVVLPPAEPGSCAQGTTQVQSASARALVHAN
jgi:4-amino-4-deoxy-L-arabinose transferase-like glycosyltransferase